MPSSGLSVTRTIDGLDIAHRIEQKLPDAVEDAIPEAATVRANRLAEVCTFLRDEPELKFEFLSSVTAVDRLEYFEVVYHLTSIRLNQMTAIKVKETDRENPRVPSVTPVWPGANLQEREAYDLMGIVFVGHPDMRRVFLWDGFDGWPLRKDYLVGPGGRFPGLERFPGEASEPLGGRG
jgi:NADH-quinone oxidoreductase subunit C